MNGHASKIAKGSLSVLLASVSIILVSFFFYPILVRLIDKESFGFYAILLAIYNIACPLVAFGIFNSIRKHMGEVEGEEKKRLAGGGYTLSLLYSVSAVVIGIGIVTLAGYLDIVKGSVYTSLVIIVLSVSLFVIYEAARSIMFGLHRESRAEGLRVLERFIAFGLGLILVYLGFGIPGVFLGILVSLLVVTIMGYFMIRPRIGLRMTLLNRGFYRYKGILFSFGGLTLISMLLAQALYQSDVLLIGYFIGGEKTGAYKAALVLAELLWLIPIAFQSVLLHHVSEMWKKGKTREMAGIITGIAKYVTLALILLGFGLFVLAEPFVKFYFGPDYGDAVLPLQILIIGSLGFGLSRIINPIIEGTGYIKEGIRISAGIVVLNIALNILLIPIYGIKGAAVATSISYFAKLFQYLFLLKKVKIEALVNYPARRMALLAISFPVLLYPFVLLPISSLIQLLLIPPLGLLIFLVISRTLDMVRWDEFRKMISLLR